MSIALITGGSGHVGSNLVRKLTEKGYKIRTIDFDGDHRAFEGFDVELIRTEIASALSNKADTFVTSFFLTTSPKNALQVVQ